MYKPKKVLFLAAHPDDELNAAGTLNKFGIQGSEVYYAVFSECEEDAVELDYTPKVLFTEMEQSLNIIGIESSNIYRWDYHARYLLAVRQSILEKMIILNEKISPDLVIVPNTKDLHQDHITITQEARRVFRQCSIFGYESVRVPITSENICFIKLEEDNWFAKRNAMKCYKTQSFRIDIAVREHLARVRGLQIGCNWAEAFEVVRLCS